MHINKDLVSIIVPLYNYSNYIEDNIKSVLEQTYKNWELIIVDDCSKDNPLKVIDKYLSPDNKIQYIKHDKNLGYSAAKNTGIKKSQGQYIVTLDADDMLTKKSIEIRKKYLDNHINKFWVHGKSYEFGGLRPYKFQAKERLAQKRLMIILKTKKYKDLWKSIHAQSVMVRRSAYIKSGLYDTSLFSMADKEMWYRLIYYVGIPGYVNKFVCCYRNHSKQMHRKKSKIKNVDKLKNKLYTSIRHNKRNINGLDKILK